MRLERGKLSFLFLALVAAAVFGRLGIWQLDRLEERRAANALRTERGALPPLELGRAGALSGYAREGRRAVAWGEYDLGRELVLRARPMNGRQGVHLLTPFRLDGERSGELPALMVLRGWLPAVDGLQASLDDARPADGAATAGVARVSVAGLVRSATPAEGRRDSVIVREVSGEPHGILTLLDLEAVSRFLPYPVVTEFYLRASEPGLDGPGLVVLPEPTLTEGSHFVYALQWFSFAAIALIGTAFYMRRNR